MPSRTPGQHIPPWPSNPILTSQQRQWLFKPADLLRTPSIIDGMSHADETSNRFKGVSFITQVCVLLHLPQLTLHTASVFLHRFFCRFSMVDKPERRGYHHYAVAATCLFLASKVEENYRKMKEMIIACCRVAQKDSNLVVDEQSKEYWRWRDTILLNEDLLLEALCFDLSIEQPYKFLYKFLCHFRVDGEAVLRNTAWAFLNDANMTTLYLLYPPRTIAAASLYFAAKMSGITFPDEDGRPWWEVLDVAVIDIKRVVNVMAERYEDSTVQPKGGKYERTPEDSTNIHRTRREKTPGTPVSVSGSMKREREEDPSEDTKTVRNGSAKDSSSPTGRDGPDAKRVKLESEAPTSHPTHMNTTTLTTHHSRERSNNSNSIPTSHPPPPPPPPAPSPPQNPRQSNAYPSISNSEDADSIQARIDSIVNGAASTSSHSNRRPSSQSSNRPPFERRGSSREQERGIDRERERGDGRREDWGGHQMQSRESFDRYGDQQMPSQRNESGEGHGAELYRRRSGSSGDHWDRRGSGDRDRDMRYDSRERRRSSGSGRPEYVGPGPGRERGYSNADRSETRGTNRTRERGASEEGEV